MGFCLDPPCIASEYCARGSLLDVLRAAAADPGAAAALTWRRTLDMALGGATGMLHLHTRSPQVIHRDLKSPNLLVDDNWRVKVRCCPRVAATFWPPLRSLCLKS
jgi:serine/threonine protein kinase